MCYILGTFKERLSIFRRDIFVRVAVLAVDVGPCLYGFTIDRAWEENVLLYILYLHKKMRSLNSHCTGYENFKDGLMFIWIYLALIWLQAVQTRIISIIMIRWRNLGFWWSAENFENVWVMLQKIKQSKDTLMGFL